MSGLSSVDDSGTDRFRSLTTGSSALLATGSSFFSTGGLTGVLCAALVVAVVVVVQELPLLIFRIIRGESQPESGVLELLVVTSKGGCSLSVDGSCGGDGFAG